MNKDLTCNQVSALINFYIEGKLNPRLKNMWIYIWKSVKIVERKFKI